MLLDSIPGYFFWLVKPYDVYSYYDVLRDFKINKKGKLLSIGLLGCVYGFNYTYIIRANRGVGGPVLTTGLVPTFDLVDRIRTEYFLVRNRLVVLLCEMRACF